MKNYTLALMICLSNFSNITAQTHNQFNMETPEELKIYKYLDSIISDPTNFEPIEFEKVYGAKLKPREFGIIAKYLIDNKQLFNKSGAHEDLLGDLNNWRHKRREKSFSKQIKRNYRAKTKYVVLAEGDSWFNYPIILRDLIGNLKKNRPDYLLKSMGAGGDWLSNIVLNDELTEEFNELGPNIVLLSGGGNDFAGNNNLSAFINPAEIIDSPENLVHSQNIDIAYQQVIFEKIIPLSLLNIPNSDLRDIPEYLFIKDIEQLNQLQTKLSSNPNLWNEFDQESEFKQLNLNVSTQNKYLNNNFFRFIRLIEIQYIMILDQIEYFDPIKFGNTHFILQGYDYPFPSSKRGDGLNIIQILANAAFNNGKWLDYPLKYKGITTQDEKNLIMKSIVDHFYLMLHRVQQRYPDNVSIIDARGTCPLPKDWFDELHPKNRNFRRISKAYEELIDSDKKGRVIKVIEHY